MSDSHEPEEAPRAPIIDHAPAGEPDTVTGRSAAGETVSPEEPVPHEPPPPSEPPPSGPSSFGPPSPLPPPAVTRRGGTPVLLTLLLCASLGGAIYWTWTHPLEEQQQSAQADPQPAIEQAKADMLQKLQALSDRVDTLAKQQAAGSQAPSPTEAPATAPESPPGPAPASATAVADLSKRMDDLAEHMNTLSAQQAQQSAALDKVQQAPPPAAAGEPPPPAPPPAESPETQVQLANLGGKLDQALARQRASLDALEQRLGKLEQGTPSAAEANDNKRTIDTLAARVEKLEQPGPAAAEAQQNKQTIDTLAARMEKLEQPNPAAAEAQRNKQTIDSLAARVQKLEQGEGQLAGVKQDATLAVKLSAAQVALAGGQPLGDLPGAPPALARFATVAAPTEASLRAAFPQVAQTALAASRPEESQSSLFSRALARLEQTVTVRQGDHVIVGDPAAGVIARAQQELNDDDLKGAVQSLSALSGRAAAAVQDWVGQANALLAARDALAQLAAHG